MTLSQLTQKVFPEDLTGRKKSNWNDLISKYSSGELKRVPKVKMYLWAREHCGITIGLTAFKERLDKARTHGQSDRTTRKS